ncbi:MAG: hypothetical protein ACYTGV_18700 [Planctomycetota bacterium]
MKRWTKTSDVSWQWLRSKMDRLRRETFDDFLARNSQPRDLSGTIEIGLPVVYVTADQVDTIFDWKTYEGKVTVTKEVEDEGVDWFWRKFYEEYPGAQGIMVPSRAGLSADGRQALVYCGNQSAGLAGAGAYYLLSRASGSWRVVQGAVVWVS